ncbi:MAG: penicillin-insensitive murein endopeptidase [Myxococcota bacterium]|nr:penicillin-insensitive murein endopeptidase [Myxococcota bacterium]MDW8361313.1 penicillin-insensitive murein endopeptidase [Myxococcales bacterium]
MPAVHTLRRLRVRARLRRAAVAHSLVAVAATGCFAHRPIDAEAPSWGAPAHGLLFGGDSLDDEGPGFVRARPGEDTRWGTQRLVRALRRAAAEVAARHPGTAPLRIGDLSGPGGGRHPRHVSHRSGRDADIVFYSTDAAGRSVRGRGWLAVDRFGVGHEGRAPQDATAGGPYFFDTPRNWTLVRTLALDPEARVQWIFCSRGVRARLLAWGARHETDPEALRRLSRLLHQPTRGRPHDDHFHVRLACSPRERAAGCRDVGPLWPWLRRDRSPETEASTTRLDLEPALGDAVLLEALLGEPEATSEILRS